MRSEMRNSVKKKIYLTIGIIVGIIAIFFVINGIYRMNSSLKPKELIGTWYEVDSNITKEQFDNNQIIMSELTIEKDRTITYYKKPEDKEPIDYFTNADKDHTKAKLGNTLLLGQLHTFNFPSFMVHSVSRIRISEGCMKLCIDGKEHTFYDTKLKAMSYYLQKFYGVESGYEYFKEYLNKWKVEPISYKEFLDNLSSDNMVVIMLSKYADYTKISPAIESIEGAINGSQKKWYYVDGENLSDEDIGLLANTEIVAYLNEAIYGFNDIRLYEPGVIITDGGDNPDIYGISTDIEKIIEKISEVK